MNQGKNESMNLANFMFQKCSVPFSFANFQCKANSLKCTCCFRYSLVHILPTSSSKSVPIPAVFFRYLCETELSLSLQSGAHFANLIFEKCFERDRSLRSLCEIELSVLRVFCRPHLPKVLRARHFLNIFKHVSTF